jgi:hypothetical protein
VALFGKGLPGNRRSEGRLIAQIQIFQEVPEELQVGDDLIHGKGAEVIVRHGLEMGFDLLREFAAESVRDARL